MKLILADPPARECPFDTRYANLGILYLAGYVREHMQGGDLSVEYLPPDHDLGSHVAWVKERRPEVYGLSFTIKTLEVARQTVEAVKKACPRTLVVVGGAHASAMPEEVMREFGCDVCVQGEGEAALLGIVREAHANPRPDFSGIGGVWFRRDGQIAHGQPCSYIQDLDAIPLPAWDLVDWHCFTGHQLKRQKMMAPFLVSRGCPYNCTFCSNPVWRCARPWVRLRSVEKAIEEIRHLYSLGIREIYIQSDEINVRLDWTMDLCRAIRGLGFKDLCFQCNLRADKVTPEFARLLREANFWLVHLGIESANDRVLKGIGKHATVNQIGDALQMFADAGVSVFAFMMLYNIWEENGKLCHETTREVDRSLAFLRENNRRKRIRYFAWQILTPIPGSAAYEVARRHGLFADNDPRRVYKKYGEHTITIQLPGISRREMLSRIKRGVLLKNWYIVRAGHFGIWRHTARIWENLKALTQ